MKERARELRRNQTSAEGLLWSLLRGRRLRGYKFRRQYPIPPYVVDFACCGAKLVVELDGDYHDQIVERDLERQAAIEAAGWSVLRFDNRDVMEDLDAVAAAIAQWIERKSGRE